MKSTVLVTVEDPFRMELVQEACETAGHQVMLAACAESALAVLARDACNLVIADAAYAGLAEVLHEDRELNELPVVLIGGESQRARAILREPLRALDVQQVVRRVLREAKDRRRRHRSSHALRAVGDITGAGDVHQLRLSLPYELTEAQRHNRALGCVVLQAEQGVIDRDFPRCLGVIRGTDLAFRTSPTEVVLLLPEADQTGVALVVGRMTTVSDKFRMGAIVLSGDELTDEQDGERLVSAARARLA
ncbi:MAG: hypothetical protein AAF645_25025 [Myxococcota bacterium]